MIDSIGHSAQNLVVVVEDDDDLRALMVRLISSIGYPALGVASGFQALRILRMKPVVLLVVDLGLPDIAGEVVAHLAKELPRPPRLLAITGRSERPTDGLLFDAFIAKPVCGSALHQALSELLEPPLISETQHV